MESIHSKSIFVTAKLNTHQEGKKYIKNQCFKEKRYEERNLERKRGLIINR
jgi:hypothetical protein